LSTLNVLLSFFYDLIAVTDRGTNIVRRDVQDEVAKATRATPFLARMPRRVIAATSPVERPFANNQIDWKCRDDITSSHAS